MKVAATRTGFASFVVMLVTALSMSVLPSAVADGESIIVPADDSFSVTAIPGADENFAYNVMDGDVYSTDEAFVCQLTPALPESETGVYVTQSEGQQYVAYPIYVNVADVYVTDPVIYTYRLCTLDGQVSEGAATVTITVVLPSTKPVAVNDDLRARKFFPGDTYVLSSLTANDTDPRGMPLSVDNCSISQPPGSSEPPAKVAVVNGVVVMTANVSWGANNLFDFQCVVTNGEEYSDPFSVLVDTDAPKRVRVFKVGRPGVFRVYNPNRDTGVNIAVGDLMTSGRYAGGTFWLKPGAGRLIRTNKGYNPYYMQVGKKHYVYGSGYIKVRIRHKRH